MTVSFIFISAVASAQEKDEDNPLSFYNPFINYAEVKDFVFAGGTVFAENIGVGTVYDFVNTKNLTKLNMYTFSKAFTKPWKWDRSSFARNQIAHPYFGASYYTASRSNSLNLPESLAFTAGGSWMWETYLEAASNSINDIVTTTTAGLVWGETLHRLYYPAVSLLKPLGFTLSPFDFMTSSFRGKAGVEPLGEIESLSIWFGGGILYGSIGSSLKPSVVLGTEVLYNDAFGHTSREFFDCFDLYVSGLYGFNSSYDVTAYCDGLLYSLSVFNKGSWPSTWGITMDYDMVYSDSGNLSSSAIGTALLTKKDFDSFSSLKLGLEGFFTYLGASSLIYENETFAASSSVSFKNTQLEYAYLYGPGLHGFVETALPYGFKIKGSCRLWWLKTYEDSLLDKRASNKTFVIRSSLMAEKHVYRGLKLGVQGDFSYKYEDYSLLDDVSAWTLRPYLYVKWTF